MRLPHFLGFTITVIGAALACAPDGTAPAELTSLEDVVSRLEGDCSYSGPTRSDIGEEVSGQITASSTSDWSARMVLGSGAVKPSYWDSIVPVNFGEACQGSGANDGHANEGFEWGWYGAVGFEPECADGEPERHRAQESAFPDSDEEHCLTNGPVTIELLHEGGLRLARPIDFLRYVAVGSRLVESTGVATVDVTVHYNDTPGSDPAPAPMSVSARPTAWDTAWPAVASVAETLMVPSNFALRFTGGDGTADAHRLVRFFWDYPSNLGNRSGFTPSTLTDGRALVRVPANMPTRAEPYRVLLHTVTSANYPATRSDLTDTIHGSVRDTFVRVYGQLTASITGPAYAGVGNDTTFTAGGNNGAGSIKYCWKWTGGTNTCSTALPLSGEWDSLPTESITFATSGAASVHVFKRDFYGHVISASMAVQVVAPLTSVSMLGNYANQSGPVKWKQTCEWEATVVGGAGGTTSLAWSRRFPGGGWDALGSSNPLSLYVTGAPGGITMDLRVIASNSFNSVADTNAIQITTTGQSCSGLP